MKNKKYFLKISDLINELISNDNINFLKYNVKSGYPDHYINHLEERYDLVLCQSIKEFYSNIGSVEIQWKYEEKDSDLFGEINIVDLNQFINVDKFQDYWIRRFDEIDDIQKNKFIGNIKPFDYFNSDNFEISFFMNLDNVMDDQVFYFKSGFGYSKFNLSLGEYFDNLILTKGLVGWQEKFLIGKFDEVISTVESAFN